MGGRFDRILRTKEVKPDLPVERKRRKFTTRDLLILMTRLSKDEDYKFCTCKADSECTSCLIKGAKSYVQRLTPNPPVGWEIQSDDYTLRPRLEREERITIMRREKTVFDSEVIAHCILVTAAYANYSGSVIPKVVLEIDPFESFGSFTKINKDDRIVVIRNKRRKK